MELLSNKWKLEPVSVNVLLVLQYAWGQAQIVICIFCNNEPSTPAAELVWPELSCTEPCWTDVLMTLLCVGGKNPDSLIIYNQYFIVIITAMSSDPVIYFWIMTQIRNIGYNITHSFIFIFTDSRSFNTKSSFCWRKSWIGWVQITQNTAGLHGFAD